MTVRHPSSLLIVGGGALFALGLVLWWLAPLDFALHGVLRVSAGARDIGLLSAFGGLALMGPVALVAAIWLVARGRRSQGAWLVATIVSGRLVVEALKIAVQRPRPPAFDRLELVTSWSFPSSHSAGAMMTWLAFAILAGGRWPAVVGALLAAGVIGWSRVALAVHWPSDVLTGWGFGMLWVGVAWRVKSLLPRGLRRSPIES